MPGRLTRRSPFADFDELRSQLDRIHAQLVDGQDRGWTPAIDVERDNDTLTIRADVPGVKPGDVKIEVEDGVLTISGEHEEQKDEKDKNYLRRERRYGAFSRSMALPAGVDPSKIAATTKDGVVEVRIPLPAEPKSEPITITPTAR